MNGKFPVSTKSGTIEKKPFSSKILPTNGGGNLGKILTAIKHPGRPGKGRKSPVGDK